MPFRSSFHLFRQRISYPFFRVILAQSGPAYINHHLLPSETRKYASFCRATEIRTRPTCETLSEPVILAGIPPNFEATKNEFDAAFGRHLFTSQSREFRDVSRQCPFIHIFSLLFPSYSFPGIVRIQSQQTCLGNPPPCMGKDRERDIFEVFSFSNSSLITCSEFSSPFWSPLRLKGGNLVSSTRYE